jgi:hypothetical protein
MPRRQVAFLEHYLRDASAARPYLAQIPTADSGDCTTTDFFRWSRTR